MRTSLRIASIASCVAVAALAACSTTREVAYNVPVPVAPTVTVAPAVVTAPAPVVVPVASLEFGRVTNIQYFPAGTASSRANIPGALVGDVAGAGRPPTTVLGAGPASPPVIDMQYRVTVQTDQGVMRVYDVPAPGDLRIGDRVRVENGVIYHS